MVFIFSVIRRQCCQSTAMRNKMGNAQSVNCLSVNKSKHGILEAPEETDCSGITSITISRSRRRDQEKRTGRKPLKEDQAKYLPSGYALGYASGKFFKKIAAGYAPGNASGKIFALRLCSGLRLRQIFHKQFLNKYSPSGYAAGYFLKKFCLQAMPRANLKKYLPSGYTPGYASGKISGYAWGYASGKIFSKRQKIFEEIAPGYTLRSA
ncbi:hypothetical protein T06_1821 [Trichinella sp. T6]|nr:hypothetical protein T06_1821 [Trichinella sp. T6]